MPTKPLDIVRTLAAAYPEAERTFLFGDHEVFRMWSRFGRSAGLSGR